MRMIWGLLALGAIAGAVFFPGPSQEPAKAQGKVISMGHEEFGRSELTIHVGDRISFVNGSHWLHVIVPGKGARQSSQPGQPKFGPRDAHLSEHGDRWITDPWNKAGTYFITCQLHPEMTLEVRVLPRRRSAT